MFAPSPAIRPASAATTSGRNGWPRTVTWTRPTPPGVGLRRPGGDGDGHAQALRPPSAAAARTACLVGRAEQHAEDELAADDDLLDVEHVGGRAGPERGEQLGRHAWPVGSGERDEDGRRGCRCVNSAGAGSTGGMAGRTLPGGAGAVGGGEGLAGGPVDWARAPHAAGPPR